MQNFGFQNCSILLAGKGHFALYSPAGVKIFPTRQLFHLDFLVLPKHQGELSTKRGQGAPQRKYRNQRGDDYTNHLNIRYLGSVAQPAVLVAVTLGRHSDHETTYTQEVVAELDDHRSNHVTKFPGDKDWVTADSQDDHEDARGDAQDPVDGVEVAVGLLDVDQVHASDDADQADELQHPVDVALGASRKKVRQHAFVREHNDALRHQQDVLKSGKIELSGFAGCCSRSDKSLEVLWPPRSPPVALPGDGA